MDDWKWGFEKNLSSLQKHDASNNTFKSSYSQKQQYPERTLKLKVL